MVVVEGGMPYTMTKREGSCPGEGNVRGRDYVQGKCPDPAGCDLANLTTQSQIHWRQHPAIDRGRNVQPCSARRTPCCELFCYTFVLP